MGCFFMNLSEYLLYRDIEDLNKIAHVYQCDCNKNSKLELVQSIHYQMLNRTFFLDNVSSYTDSFILFCTYLIFQSSRSFTVEDLMAKGQYILSLSSKESKENPRQWISQLMSKGWLFPMRSNAHIQLEIPLEMKRFLRREWKGYWLQKIPSRTKLIKTEWVERNEGDALARDVHIFLTKLQSAPLPLTIEGVIHKRVLESILIVLSVEENPLQEGLEKKWRFGYGRRFPVYPNRFALLYDFCFMKGWIQEEREQVYMTEKGLKALYEFSFEPALKELRSYWLKLYKKPIVALPFMVSLIQELTENQWISEADLFMIIKNWLKTYYYDDETKLFDQRIIQMMVHLGLLQIGVDSKQNIRFLKSSDQLLQ